MIWPRKNAAGRGSVANEVEYFQSSNKIACYLTVCLESTEWTSKQGERDNSALMNTRKAREERACAKK